MGIFEKIRSSRAKTKAEIKAAEAKVKAEAKHKAKLDLKREKLIAQQERNLLKAEKEGLKARRKHEMKMAKQILAEKKAGKFNSDTVKRWGGTARMLTPILLPLIYRASTQIRDQIVQNRAQRSGVTGEQLAKYPGHGAPLKARIAGVREVARKSDLPQGFVRDADERLKELDAAVDNAEYMTPQQRNRAHQSIERDLQQVSDQIQDRLLDHR